MPQLLLCSNLSINPNSNFLTTPNILDRHSYRGNTITLSLYLQALALLFVISLSSTTRVV